MVVRPEISLKSASTSLLTAPSLRTTLSPALMVVLLVACVNLAARSALGAEPLGRGADVRITAQMIAEDPTRASLEHDVLLRSRCIEVDGAEKPLDDAGHVLGECERVCGDRDILRRVVSEERADRALEPC